MDHKDANKEQRVHHRRRPAHGVRKEIDRPTIVFVTACTKGHSPWLATKECHELLKDVCHDATGWFVGRYVVMPDHLHLFAAPGDMDISLDDWMQYWKSQFSKRFARKECRWLRDHWDRRLRTGESYRTKWEYVRDNPVRKGLVASTDDWPYQGEIFDLAW